jgi:hypothetical protein
MIDAMKQALEAEINLVLTDPDSSLSAGAQRALQYVSNQIQAIEQAEKQEPVVWVCRGFGGEKNSIDYDPEYIDALEIETPLYTAPSRKEWVGLTDEEIVKILDFDNPTIKQFAYAIEAKLKERNT